MKLFIVVLAENASKIRRFWRVCRPWKTFALFASQNGERRYSNAFSKHIRRPVEKAERTGVSLLSSADPKGASKNLIIQDNQIHGGGRCGNPRSQDIAVRLIRSPAF
jgi:hypothetical protein